MTEQRPLPTDEQPDGADEAPSNPTTRPTRLGRAWPAVALLGGLTVAWLLPSLGVPAPGWSAGTPPASGTELHDAIRGLPDQALVLVDLDADLGTYPEIRYATRAMLADLLAAGSRLAIISFSAEGRAVAVAEIARLRALGAGDDRLMDLGFRSGGEAAVVQLAGQGIGPDAIGPIADAMRAQPGLGAVSLAVVVGGTEIGPRLWIEQVEPRTPSLRLAAIAPAFLLPEVQPYRDSEQLVAMVATLPNAVAYGQLVASSGGGGVAAFNERSPSSSAVLLGMLVALAVLLVSSIQRLMGLRRSGARGSSG